MEISERMENMHLSCSFLWGVYQVEEVSFFRSSLLPTPQAQQSKEEKSL